MKVFRVLFTLPVAFETSSPTSFYTGDNPNKATKKHLSSRIDRVDCNLDECAEITAATRKEVSELRGEMKTIGVDVQSVHHAVQTLETKINRIEGKQDLTNEGVRRLVDYTWTWSLGNSGTTERIQEAPSSSSTPAIEMPHMTPSSKTGSLPQILSVELPSPSASNGSHKRPLQNAFSASGLKVNCKLYLCVTFLFALACTASLTSAQSIQELHEISDVVEALSSPSASNGVQVTEDANSGNPGSCVFGRKFSGISASFLTRTHGAVQSFK
ncbi:hypothetical protein Acr_06g0000540 [Actinidia rufa]|uniref:DUF1664 domain-containing protein n=1 Tax=Actinidia rufa TaxID=165716 RepID=A0A7J0ENQ4_9ERIC|nr:hypothetical protein Acr_06g0000540 [Actinidia rufa]